MKSRHLATASIIGVVALALLIIGSYLFFSPVLTSSRDTNKIVIGTTIFPLTDIVKKVGGDTVEVVQLVPAGANEHSYTLLPQQLIDVRQAKVIFMIGQGLDNHIVKPVTEVTGVPSLSVDKGIHIEPFNAAFVDEDEEEAPGHHDTGTDPHYWLTAKNAQVITQTIQDELIKVNPEAQALYQKNAKEYISALQRLDQELHILAKNAPHYEFIATHNAWEYFSKEYGFTLVFTYEPVEGKQPALSDLRDLKALVKKYSLATFYAEPQKATSSISQFMSREFGLKTKILDPIGGIEVDDSYMKLMRRNMQALSY